MPIHRIRSGKSFPYQKWYMHLGCLTFGIIIIKSELATSIIYQQIGGNVAKILGERFVKLFDPPKDHHPRWFPTPEMVWEKPVETLKTAGLSTRKAEYIRGLAEKFINKTITMELLSTLSDEELSKLLCSVRGIGPVNHH